MAFNSVQSVTNYLVPATSSPNAMAFREAYDATPRWYDFNNQNLDGIPFRPSGFFADNSQGTGPLNVLINEMGFNLSVPAGQFAMMPFPAPVGCTASVTGAGLATVVFVDFPIQPWMTAAGGGAIPDPLPVSGPLTDAELRANPVSVSLAQFGLTMTTPAITTATGPGAVASARMFSLTNTGAAAATVLGASLPAGQTITFEAPVGCLVGEVTYDATGTTLLIASLV